MYLRRALQGIGLSLTDDEAQSIINVYGIVDNQGSEGGSQASSPRRKRHVGLCFRLHLCF